MNLKFYRESLRLMDEGYTHHSGEDGYPYVDDHILMVTDGLGGTGAMRHSLISKELFDAETIVHTLFNGVYEHLDDERFASYVRNSFLDLYDLKDYYNCNINALKKTSYMGSRLVSAVMLYHSLYDERLDTEKLFSQYAELEDDKKEEFLANLGSMVSEIIATDLPKIAKNGNIVYESGVANRKMLVTTFCTTLFREHDDYVEAFCLVSGDSRPYVWSATDGLRQLVADQERSDGGMTSCIYLNEKCYILAKYCKFSKPCVLFNASDGCFDSGAFVSPMAFEKFILETIIESENIESAEQSFVSSFDKYGTHDDSSTLALRTFGYDTFEIYQEDCARRLGDIQLEYIDKFDGLLASNYSYEYDKLRIQSNRRITALKKEFEAEDAVWAYCEAAVIKTNPELSEDAPLDGPALETQKRIDGIKEKIAKIISMDFAGLVDSVDCDSSLSNDRLVIENKNIRDDILRFGAELKTLVADLDSSLDEVSGKLKGYFAQITKVGIPNDYSDYRNIEFSTGEKAFGKLKRIKDFFTNMADEEQRLVSKISKLMKVYKKNNLELAKKYPDVVSAIVDKLLKGDLTLDGVLLTTEDVEDVESMIQDISDDAAEVNSIKTKKRNEKLDKLKKRHWSLNTLATILAVVDDEQSGISEELRVKVKAELDSFATESAELKEKADAQKILLDKYFEKYSELM